MAEFTDKPGYAFGGPNGIRPPRAVSDFLRGKTQVRTRGFRELEPQEHAVAFTVAQSAKFDILGDVQAALQKALDEGQTYETFAKGLAPKLQEAGWWGVKTVAGRERQLGSPRRLKTIYRANMRAARAAGQWERIERVKEDLPYLVYRLGPSERHRPHHESKNGWVLPVDHPFWNEWMPPNGWGCKCHVRQIGAREAERLGIVEQVNIPRRTVREPGTLKPRDLPAGLDPAWSSNPGKTRLANVEALLADKLEADLRKPALGDAMARAATRDVVISWRLTRLPGAAFASRLPVAVLGGESAKAGGFARRIVTIAGSVAKKLVDRGPGTLADRLLRVQRALDTGPHLSHPDGGLIAMDISPNPKPGDTPLFIVLTSRGDDPRPFLSTVFQVEATNYVWNKIAEGATILRDTGAFEAWRAANPLQPAPPQKPSRRRK